MKEVEVKIQIDNPDVIASKLQELGFEKGEMLRQEDDIFFTEGIVPNTVKSGDNILRIRTINGDRHKFTLKQRTERVLASLEHETFIEDKDELEKAFILLGYHKSISLSKSRVKYNKDDITVCIDEVKDLGRFIEIEKIVEPSVDSGQLQNELMQFAVDNLGVSMVDRIDNSYDVMLYEKSKI